MGLSPFPDMYLFPAAPLMDDDEVIDQRMEKRRCRCSSATARSPGQRRQLAPSGTTDATGVARLAGLDPAARYELRVDPPRGSGAGMWKKVPAWSPPGLPLNEAPQVRVQFEERTGSMPAGFRRATVYRRDVLLVPQNQLGQLGAINEALGPVGLVAEPPLPLERLVGFVPPEWSPLWSLPRPVKLRVREDSPEPRRVDAWAGTQALWGRVDMTSIGVEHLMAGSAQVGVGGVRIAGTNWATEGSPAGGDSGARAGTGYATRIPVALMLPPTRPVTSGKRRPVDQEGGPEEREPAKAGLRLAHESPPVDLFRRARLLHRDFQHHAL